nr:MAG TPA: hypothetical protein [Caudoviricetes sp.]
MTSSHLRTLIRRLATLRRAGAILSPTHQQILLIGT